MSFTPLDPLNDAGGDARVDGATMQTCKTFSGWSSPVEITTFTTVVAEWEPALSPDGNTVVFARKNLGLFVATRTGATTFTDPTAIPVFDDRDFGPTWGPNGDRLYVASERTTTDAFRLWEAAHVGVVFEAPAIVPSLAGEILVAPTIRFDDLEMYWCTPSPGAAVVRGERATPGSPWTVTGFESQITLGGTDTGWPSLSGDGLTLYVEGITVADGTKVYQATRASLADRFGAPTLVPGLVSPVDEIGDPEVSRDGLTLLTSVKLAGASSETDVYISTRTCLD